MTRTPWPKAARAMLVPRVYDARPSWQRAIAIMAIPLALCLGGCDTGAAEASRWHDALATGTPFSCTPVRVYDGDGPIWCAEGPRVRLAGIAAREMDGTCRPGHPCPTVSAEASRDHLAGLLKGSKSNTVLDMTSTGHVLIAGPKLSCVSNGSAGGKRVAAWCESPTAGDLSCRMVRDGYALRWKRYWKAHLC